jgi:hypothetical protein
MMMLMIAGIAVLAAGLLAIVFGIPVKEFSFGNTVILAGAIAACTGAVLLGLALVVRELQNIARRLGVNPEATSRANAERQAAAGSGGQPAGDGFPFNRDRLAHATPDGAEPAAQPSSSPGSPAPWQEEVAARDRGRSRGDAAPAPAPEPAPATKPRRNLLFSSSSRKERERALAAGTPDAAKPDPAKPDPGPAPVVPVPAPAEPAPVTFEDAWPQSERARSDALRRTRTPSTFAEPAAGTPMPDRPVARIEEPPAVTVLKSGVVDGMAYSLYSDGSIEAQMPEGMMRFASIDELRSHLDQRP